MVEILNFQNDCRDKQLINNYIEFKTVEVLLGVLTEAAADQAWRASPRPRRGCRRSRATEVRWLVQVRTSCKNGHNITYDCFNKPFAVSPYKSLYYTETCMAQQIQDRAEGVRRDRVRLAGACRRTGCVPGVQLMSGLLLHVASTHKYVG